MVHLLALALSESGFDVLDGAIEGTAIKEGGQTPNPVDGDRAASLVAAARE
ncbi:MAG: hypothetical protein V5A25_04595 [Halovenus sp.]